MEKETKLHLRGDMTRRNGYIDSAQLGDAQWLSLCDGHGNKATIFVDGEAWELLMDRLAEIAPDDWTKD